MKSVLVTGGAGFIGSHFICRLLAHVPGVSIVNLDKLTYAGDLSRLSALPAHAQYQFIEGDICDAALVTDIFKHYNIDTAVHFAAESHVDRSIESAGVFVETNVMGTLILLECAKNYWEKNDGFSQKRFHHISTDEVYGSLKATDPAFTEQSPYRPNSPYSASKASSDHLVRSYYKTHGLPVTISNCSNNYGPNQDAEKLIPKTIHCLQERLPIPVYADGSNIRDWLHVDDHCDAIELIMEKGVIGQTYNIGGDSEISNLALVTLLCRLFDEMTDNENSEQLIQFVTDRPGHDWRYAIDHKKLTDELGWQPSIALESGLKQLFKVGERHQQSRERKRPVMQA